jgi:hypothetical protein
MAVGLGSMDMPVPSVAEWEWLNWKFPRAVHSGETIYARWTLTQKRAPVGGAPTAIVVWRVDVHTASGALCAEGEVGASVMRKVGAAAPRPGVEEPAVAAAVAVPAARRRRRRRAPAGEGAKGAVDAKAALTPEATAPAPAQPGAPTAQAGKAAGGTRRRRRRRPASATQARNGDSPAPVPPSDGGIKAEPVHDGAPAAAAALPAGTGSGATNPLTRAIRRLRRP